VVSTTPRSLYSGERPGTHCTGGWVGPRAGLDMCKKNLAPTGIQSLDRPACNQSLYRLSYPAQLTTCSSIYLKKAIVQMFKKFSYPLILWILKLIYQVYESRILVSPEPSTQLFKLHYNVILPSILSSFKWLLSFNE
jgi:hypothetical protein